MQEIATNIFTEHNSLGLTAGIIQNSHGTVLIDSPIRQEDTGSWKGTTARLVTGKDRYMVVLDTNYDRLLSIKGCDCAIVAHAETIPPIRSRFSPARVNEEGMPFESSEPGSGSTRIHPPEIIFEDKMSLHLGELSIELEHHPGSNQAGIWAIIPERKVVFVGDSVIVDQPPFLAYANLEVWEQDLKELTSRKFKDYQVVSARSGVVDGNHIKTMEKNIAFISKMFAKLTESNAPLEEWRAKIPAISSRMSELDLFNSELFYNRLHWGITTYYELHHRERG
jgi:glyoxylase-like metal-dependent hydrolase (beta-lactamase superfamily II)